MPTGAVDESKGTNASTPDLDVWGWSSNPKSALADLLEVKRAVMVHRALRNQLEARINEVQDPKAKPFAEGIGRWMLCQYGRAYPLLSEIKNPSPAALFALAECCMKGEVAHDGARAMRRPDVAAELLAGHPEVGTSAAVAAARVESLLFNHDYEAARKALAAAAGLLKGSADDHYFQGRLAEDEGDYETAENRYLKAIEIDRNHRGALLRLAYQYDLGGDDEQALEYYRRLSELKPLDSHALINYGVLLEDQGRYAEAIRCYRAVLSAHPTHRRAQSYLRDARGSLDMVFDEDIERRHDKRNRLLRIPISDFELSVRARNCLAKMNIETLGDLVQRSEAELLAYKNFGDTSLNEIKVLLESKGLRLGMNLNEDPIPSTLGLMEPKPAKAPAAVRVPPGVDPAVLNIVLADLELSVRCRKALAQVKAVTIGDLLQHTESELLAIKNFGQTSLNELKARLAEHNVSFGT